MKDKKINRMVGTAILMALVIILQMLGSLIHIGPFSISLVLIPIVVGSSVYDEKVGAILGGTFGVVVLISCINGTDLGGAMVFESNPAICTGTILGKGILAGWVSGLVFRAFSSKNTLLASIIAAVVCPIVNTGFFLGSMLVFFRSILSAWAGGTGLVTYIILSLVGINFAIEVIINGVFSPLIVRLVNAIKK